jgi:hypothetical protein
MKSRFFKRSIELRPTPRSLIVSKILSALATSSVWMRIYARAAAWIVGADRWSEARWADLETQLGVTTKQDPGTTGPSATTAATAGAVRPIRRPVQRRTVRSSYMR